MNTHLSETQVWFSRHPDLAETSGLLLHMNENGFRAAHCCVDLRAGREVRFRNSIAEGKALVMWNRILPVGIESGFLVLGAEVRSANKRVLSFGRVRAWFGAAAVLVRRGWQSLFVFCAYPAAGLKLRSLENPAVVYNVVEWPTRMQRRFKS
jgi:hypothetical protein